MNIGLGKLVSLVALSIGLLTPQIGNAASAKEKYQAKICYEHTREILKQEKYNGWDKEVVGNGYQYHDPWEWENRIAVIIPFKKPWGEIEKSRFGCDMHEAVTHVIHWWKMSIWKDEQ